MAKNNCNPPENLDNFNRINEFPTLSSSASSTENSSINQNDDDPEDNKNFSSQGSRNQQIQYLDVPEVNGSPIQQGQHNKNFQFQQKITQQDKESCPSYGSWLTGVNQHNSTQLQHKDTSQEEESSPSFGSWLAGLHRNQRVQNKAINLENQRQNPLLQNYKEVPKGQTNPNLDRINTENLLRKYDPKKHVTYKIGNKTYYSLYAHDEPTCNSNTNRSENINGEGKMCPRQRSGYKPGGGLTYDCPISGKCSDQDYFCTPRSSISTAPNVANASGDRRVQNVGVPKISVTKATCSQKHSQDPYSRPPKSISGSKKVRFHNMKVPKVIVTEAINLENQGHDNKICPRQEKGYKRGQADFYDCPISSICEDDSPICVAQNQNVTMESNQSPARWQREQCRNTNDTKIANIVRSYFQNEQNQCQSNSQNDVQHRNINDAEIANIVRNFFQNEQNQCRSSSRDDVQHRNKNITEMLNTVRQYFHGDQADSGFLGRQTERRKRDILRRNHPPSGPPSPPHSYSGERRNRRQKQAASQNRKQSPRVWMPTKKPNKKSAFTLTDEQKALVLDNYYPGLIHDAVNQKADFNEIAKQFVTPETAVDDDKAEKGMSLIEAFDTRIKYEQINSSKLLTVQPDKVSEGKKVKKNAKPPYQLIYGPLDHPVVADILLEDNVRATAIPLDLQHYVRSTAESDPVRAIACLTRAQQLNDYYRLYKGAEHAANMAPPDKIEEAALQGVKFQIDSLSAQTATVDTEFYKSLELVSYIGVTKPD